MKDIEAHILRTMRNMAWERAKGELRSMLQTYWGDMEKFTELDKEIKEFITHIEENGIQE